MRADRLLSILMLLQTKGRMTARELAERLEVSERTIYRDLEALSIAGIPVCTERGPGGGCYLLDGYQTKLNGLNEAEVRALFLFTMAMPLADLGLSDALNDARLKLTSALPEATRPEVEQISQRFHLDATWWYHNDNATSYLPILQEAVWHDHMLRITYLEDDGMHRSFLLAPYGLVAKASVWYLVAMVDTEPGVFRVSRIQSIERSEETFVRHEHFDLARYWTNYCAQLEAASPRYPVQLRIAPDDVPLLPRILPAWNAIPVEDEERLEQWTPPTWTHQEKPIWIHQEKKETFAGASARRSQEKKRSPLSVSTRQRREKKALYHMPGSQEKKVRFVSRHQEKKLSVLSNSGEWTVLSRQKKEKKQIRGTGTVRSVSSPLQKKANSQDIKKAIFQLLAGLQKGQCSFSQSPEHRLSA